MKKLWSKMFGKRICLKCGAETIRFRVSIVHIKTVPTMVLCMLLAYRRGEEKELNSGLGCWDYPNEDLLDTIKAIHDISIALSKRDDVPLEVKKNWLRGYTGDEL